MTVKEPKEKRINDIMDAAVREFVEKGYEGASMESIARRAGLTKGGVYHHFRSKDEIMLAANQRYLEPVLAVMADLRSRQPPVRGLRIFIRYYLRYWSRRPQELVFSFLSVAKMLASPLMWPLIEEYLQGMLAYYEEIFCEGQRRGELKPHDAHSRALVLNSALDSVACYLVMCRDMKPLATARQMERVFLDEILAENSCGTAKNAKERETDGTDYGSGARGGSGNH